MPPALSQAIAGVILKSGWLTCRSGIPEVALARATRDFSIIAGEEQLFDQSRPNL